MTGTYSPELVALSLLVAIAASYVAFALAAHISTTKGWSAVYWLAGGAIAMGTGIWSMHFIGMLAFKLPIPMAYGVETTLASLVIAILVSGFALYVVSSRAVTTNTLLISGTIMGLGIVAMHYLGMQAMEIAPPLTYDLGLVLLSILVAVSASALALTLGFRLRSDAMTHVIWKRLLGALAMGSGIAAMHYTGMAAAQFAPGTVCAAPGFEVDQQWLAIAVAASCFLFLGATMLILTIDVRLAHQLDEANARIAKLARQDPLTGLANRRVYLEQLDQAFKARQRDGSSFAILFMDIDGFKDVNDTLGHAVGDALLIEIASRLKDAVRQSDVIARLGGDEFAILQRGLETATDAGTLAAKVCAALAERYQIQGNDIAVTASIGIARPSTTATTPADLMVQADLALYRAKDDGRSCYRFHNSDLDRQVHTRVLLARELELAIERGELELLFRPQIDIGSGRIAGLEARVRWNHPARGTIKPSTFIPIAERTGTIAAVTAWVFDEACRQLARWQEHAIAPPTIALSVCSGRIKVPPDVAADLTGSMARWGIAPAALEIDLTEPVLMQAVQRYPATLEALRRLGVNLCIDEFGTGYSSLVYLASDPVNRFKIPRAIIAGILRNAHSEQVVRATVQLARELGARVIADGVETQAQASFLLAAGCEQAQGPFFSPALTAWEATLLLQNAAAEAERAAKLSHSPAA
jgi:diguanylate cyclase (GGDEF)-like protein